MNILSSYKTITKILFGFAKWSKPKPNLLKVKQKKAAKAQGDEKAAKLSKSQQENQAKRKKQQQQRIQEQSKLKIARIKVHDAVLQKFIPKETLDKMYERQLIQIKGIIPKKKKEGPKVQQQIQNPYFLPNQLIQIDPVTGKKKKKNIYGNFLAKINKSFEIKKIEPNLTTRRVGVLGVKLGMTSLWDDWGKIIPVTAIQLDRVQVVQIKKPQVQNGYYHVQIGQGTRNLKRLKKPEIGHFMKAGVPPKKTLSQFTVSQNCLLPVGYMIGARHYTPGMYVDVIGKTVGHGFSGTIKKFGFRRQPATHGNSTTTRVLGSTGGRQDPGRVFKQKKMYGRMGGNITVQRALRVFKIDCDKNILYLYGSVPGKSGTVVKVRDAVGYYKHEQNMQLGHYPTFIEEPGKTYAKQFIMFSGERDPDQIQYHDNQFILDDKQQEADVADSPDAQLDQD